MVNHSLQKHVSARWGSAPIECVPKAFSLDELPEYEALSYIREDPANMDMKFMLTRVDS